MTAQELIAKYKPTYDGMNESQKAKVEAMVWEATKPEERRGIYRRVYLATAFGCTQQRIQIREALSVAKIASKQLWDRIDSGQMLPSTAHRLLKEARTRSRAKGSSLKQTIATLLEEHDALPVARTADGREWRKRKPSRVPRPVMVSSKRRRGRPENEKDTFNKIRELVGAYMSKKLGDIKIEPVELESLWQSLERELNALLFEFKQKAYDVASRARGEHALAQEISRREVLRACRILQVPPPEKNEMPNLSVAKKNKRTLARHLHPDMNSGDESLSERYDEAIKAYNVLEQYVERYGKKLSSSV